VGLWLLEKEALKQTQLEKSHRTNMNTENQKHSRIRKLKKMQATLPQNAVCALQDQARQQHQALCRWQRQGGWVRLSNEAKQTLRRQIDVCRRLRPSGQA
jgi:hypothetical protein